LEQKSITERNIHFWFKSCKNRRVNVTVIRDNLRYNTIMKKSLNKILIVQTAFLGDVILALPLVTAIKKHIPESTVHFCLRPDAFNLIENNPNLSGIVIYDKRGKDKGLIPFMRMVKKLKETAYDCAIVPHRSFRSALMCYLARIPLRIGFDRSTGSSLYSKKITYKDTVHEIERNLSLLSPLEIEESNIYPEIFISPGDKDVVNRKLKAHNVSPATPFVTIAPGSEWETKRWTVEGYAGLIELLWNEKKILSILAGGSKDRRVSEEVQHNTGVSVLNFTDELTLRESCELIKRSKVLISNDSGAVHLAAAVRQKVIAIYGPTSPDFGFFPYGEGNAIIKSDILCSPCSIHGGRKCREKHFRCMKDITPEQVFKKAACYL